MANVVTSQNIDSFLKSTDNAEARTNLEVAKVDSADMHDLLSSADYADARSKLEVGKVDSADMHDLLSSVDYNAARSKLGVVEITGATRSVLTIADLKSLSIVASTNGSLVQVLGYHVAGDHGGGQFYWDATDTQTANDGTIIEANGVTTGRWKRLIEDEINAHWFGAKGDLVYNDGPAIQAAGDYAIASGKTLKFSAGDYVIGQVQSVSPRNVQFRFTEKFSIIGEGNVTFHMKYGSPVGMSIAPASNPNPTSFALTDSVEWGATALKVTNVNNVAIGMRLKIASDVVPITTYNYKKQVTTVVSDVDTVNNIIYLTDPLNFHFDTNETNLTTSVGLRGSLEFKNIKIKQYKFGSHHVRFDLYDLQDTVWENVTTEGSTLYSTAGGDLGDVVFMSGIYNFRGRDCTAIGGRYNYNCSNGSRRVYFTNVSAIDANDFCDFNTFSYDCRITNFIAHGLGGILSPHPSFEVHYDNVSGYNISSGGIDMRCAGGSIKNSVLTSGGGAGGGITGMYWNNDYKFMAAYYNLVFENIKAPNITLSSGDHNNTDIINCDINNINIDNAVRNTVGVTTIDEKTKFQTVDKRASIQRTPIQGDDAGIYKAPIPDYGSMGAGNIWDIANITNASPATVTLVAGQTHNLVINDVVRLDGINGITGVGRKFLKVKNITTTSFDLYELDETTPLDTTASGLFNPVGYNPRATKQQYFEIAYDYLKAPIVGNTPYRHFRSNIRTKRQVSSKLLGNPGIVTIPIKIINTYGIQEAGLKTGELIIKAAARYDGTQTVKYQINSYNMVGNVHSKTILENSNASATKIVITVDNFREHYRNEGLAEGSYDVDNDPKRGTYYFMIDVTVQINGTNRELQFIDIDYREKAIPS